MLSDTADRNKQQQGLDVLPVSSDGNASTVDAAHLAADGKDTSSKPVATKVQTTWWQRTMFDSWVPEIIALAISTSCLVAIVIVVFVFNNRAAPNLRYGITLNAVIATLATASRSMLMYTVAAAISQLKWCWYLESRKLQHMQVFDDASRGPWGAATMLFTLRVRPLASLGAVITILVLAFDPFVQLVLTFPTRMVEDKSMKVSNLTRSTDFMWQLPSDGWNNAMQVGIWGEPQQFDRQPSCPTGNCSWPAFRSIGWCSKCQDARTYVEITNCNLTELFQNRYIARLKGCEASFGHGDTYSLYQSQDDVSAMVAKDVVWPLHNLDWISTHNISTLRNVTYLDVWNPVAAFAHLSVDYSMVGDNGSSPSAVSATVAEECVISLCDMQYQVSTENGKPSTNTDHINYGFIMEYPYVGSAAHDIKVTCWQAEKQYQKTTANLGRNGILNSGPGWAKHDNSAFCPTAIQPWSGFTSYARSITDSVIGNGNYSVYKDNERYIYLASSDPDYTTPVAQYIARNSLEKVLSGIAASLSRLGLSGVNTTAKVPGFASVSETYVQTSWYWLVLPFALNVCGIAFLLLAITKSRRKKVKPWKTSILPLIYHGLEPGLLNRRPVSEDVSAMEIVAEGTRVRLLYSDGKKKTMLKQT